MAPQKMRRWAKDALGTVLLFVAYFATARLGLLMDAVAGFATLVWPPTGIALAALGHLPRVVAGRHAGRPGRRAPALRLAFAASARASPLHGGRGGRGGRIAGRLQPARFRCARRRRPAAPVVRDLSAPPLGRAA